MGLSYQHQLYVKHRVAGNSAAQAARLAGYRESYARRAAEKIEGRHPEIRSAIEEARANIKSATEYDAARVVTEAQELAAFARQSKNPMAAVKCLELIAKVTGVLDERSLVLATPDLVAAIAAARSRVNLPVMDAEFTALPPPKPAPVDDDPFGLDE